MVPLVKNLPPNAGDARDAGSIPDWEDLLEYEWQPTPVVLPEKFHGQEEPGRLQLMESQRVKQDWAT